MPDVKGNRVGVKVYFRPETFKKLEESKNSYMSSSAYCAMIIEEVLAANNM